MYSIPWSLETRRLQLYYIQHALLLHQYEDCVYNFRALFKQNCILFPCNTLFSFPTKILYPFINFPMHATRLAHIILPYLINLIIFGEVCKWWSSFLCSLLQRPPTSSHLGPNIVLSTLFSDTLNLCSSLNVRDQVSDRYKTKVKIKFLERRREHKGFWTEWW
jgi:hypothetical protein